MHIPHTKKKLTLGNPVLEEQNINRRFEAHRTGSYCYTTADGLSASNNFPPRNGSSQITLYGSVLLKVHTRDDDIKKQGDKTMCGESDIIYGEVNSVKKQDYKIWLSDGVY